MTPTEPTGFGFVEAPSTDLDAIAVQWHAMSDHGREGTPLGGYLCNCERVAVRVAAFVGAPVTATDLDDMDSIPPAARAYVRALYGQIAQVAAERDRARDTAVRLEQELAEVREGIAQDIESRAARVDEPVGSTPSVRQTLMVAARIARTTALAQSPTDTPQGAQIGAGGLMEGAGGESVHVWVRGVGCKACKAARKSAEHSTCWACSHEIDHAYGHDCPEWNA